MHDDAATAVFKKNVYGNKFPITFTEFEEENKRVAAANFHMKCVKKFTLAQ